MRRKHATSVADREWFARHQELQEIGSYGHISGENAPAKVLFEIAAVLTTALGLSLIVNVSLAALHIN